ISTAERDDLNLKANLISHDFTASDIEDFTINFHADDVAGTLPPLLRTNYYDHIRDAFVLEEPVPITGLTTPSPTPLPIVTKSRFINSITLIEEASMARLYSVHAAKARQTPIRLALSTIPKH